MRGDVYGASHPLDSDTRAGLPRMEALGLATFLRICPSICAAFRLGLSEPDRPLSLMYRAHRVCRTQ
jgi:hypothetical protein